VIGSKHLEAIIIGGGFYGVSIASYLVKKRGFTSILLIEREPELLMRASFNNQARVHNGYHYPRSFTTAYRSRINLPRFIADWPSTIKRDFTSLYAVARRNSKVTARQFEHFCAEIDARIEVAEPCYSELFERRLIERVYLVEEYVFDAVELLHRAKKELNDSNIRYCLNTCVEKIERHGEGLIKVITSSEGNSGKEFARYVFNCTYSGLNQFGGDFQGAKTRLKHEITEMALISMPASLSGLGVTVMDGPFFSALPFPSTGQHTLSHVRYTPHMHWFDDHGIDPYAKLDAYDKSSRFNRMVRAAGLYLPALLEAKYVDSLFEVKTVLVQNESDDGRPILFERHPELPGFYSILGGKIDNIYDVLEILEREPL
jgi:glycine/D-amino acid oxidase-like deaminating enzyme